MRCRRGSELLVGLLVAGLLTAAPASAGCADCARTTATVSGPHRVPVGQRATFRVRISSRGEGRPVGRVTFLLRRPDGRTLPARAKAYDGAPVRFRTPPLRRTGRYAVTVVFLAAPGTFWKESVGGASIRVG